MKKWDVVIIGSGMSSLVTAALLSKKGKSVGVLEQYNKAGGYMHCFSRFGIRFDTGAHYVGAMEKGQAFRTLLSYLGVYSDELFAPLDPDGFDVFHFPDFQISLPKGYEQVQSRLAERFPHEARGIAGFLARVREATLNFPTYEFGREPDFNLLARDLETPLDTVVREHVSDPKLRTLLTAYCSLHGVRPTEVAFGMHAIVLDSLIQGPFGLAKGGDALTSRLVEQIRSQGGEVLLKKKVAQIENSGRLAQAVVTQDGERYEADWVISGIDPKATFGLVADTSPLSPAFRSRLADVKMSCGIFGVYAACSSREPIPPGQNHYFFDDAENPEAMFETRAPDARPAAVFASPTQRLAGLPGKAGINLHAYGPMEWFEPWRGTRFGKRPEDYEALKDGYAKQVIAAVDRYRPGFSATVTDYVTSSPVTNLHFNGSTDGSAYGIYHSIQNTGPRAFGPRTHVANLLLTGQSCLFPGLLGAAISGLRTAGHIVGIKPILGELTELRGMA